MILDSITKLSLQNKSAIGIKTLTTSSQINFGDNKATSGLMRQAGFSSSISGKTIYFN
ncbi:hypothetical protein RB653_009520 [Dictyostelium firmibasis]|uniref:Uncharacterized protein n=1 Tax=Dictyostelium firmibasis TaxID=79012 RepID=A0AAN7U1V5_9MYCE